VGGCVGWERQGGKTFFCERSNLLPRCLQPRVHARVQICGGIQHKKQMLELLIMRARFLKKCALCMLASCLFVYILFALVTGASAVAAYWTLELVPKNVHDVRIVVVPDAWPYHHDCADIELPAVHSSFKILQEEYSGLQSKSLDVIVDFYPNFCIRVFKFDAASQAAHPEFCCNDTVISLAFSKIFGEEQNVICYDGYCKAEIALARSITAVCSASLLAAGFQVAYEQPYQIRTTVTVEAFASFDSRLPLSPSLSVFGSVLLDSRNGSFGDFFVLKKSGHRPAPTPSHSLYDGQSSAESLDLVAVSHRFSDRLTTQELFYLDRLFCTAIIVPCPLGMRLQTVSHSHYVCATHQTAAAAARPVTLWFGADPPPTSSSADVFVFDCSLTSPALTSHKFFPWCLFDAPQDMFVPSPSLSHLYSNFSSPLLNASSSNTLTRRMQGKLALSTILRFLSRGWLRPNQELLVANPISHVDLMRVHVDRDTLASLRKVNPLNSKV
jgi:hypothetical protein